MRHYPLLLAYFITLGCLTFYSCKLTPDQLKIASESTIPRDSIKAAISAQNVLFAKALANSDSVGLANIYASDAEFMAPNESLTQGRVGIVHVIGGYIREGMINFNLTSFEILSVGEMVTVQKSYILTDKNGGNKDIGKSVEVWKVEDGKYKIFRDCFNSDLPCPTN
jgi:ketosteroid isomerase-like protein